MKLCLINCFRKLELLVNLKHANRINCKKQYGLLGSMKTHVWTLYECCYADLLEWRQGRDSFRPGSRSIGNYLNQLYECRKLESVRGFRCITVLAAMVRKGCWKCKVDYRRWAILIRFLVYGPTQKKLSPICRSTSSASVVHNYKLEMCMNMVTWI